jgi:hypothetical protein
MNAAAEFLLEVEREVRDADRVGDRASAEHGLGGAACLGAVGLRVRPELDGYADDLRPTLPGEQSRYSAVHASRHGDGDALWAGVLGTARGRCGRPFPLGPRDRSQRQRGSGGALQGPVESVGCQLGGVPLRGGESAQRPVDFVDAEGSRLKDRRAVDDLRDGGRGGPRGPAALGVEADRGDSALGDHQRDPREIAAGGAAGRAGERTIGRGAAPRLVSQVLLEELLVHWMKGRARFR